LTFIANKELKGIRKLPKLFGRTLLQTVTGNKYMDERK